MVLNQKDKVKVTLNLVRPAPSGWLDRVLDLPVPQSRSRCRHRTLTSRNVGSGSSYGCGRWTREP